MYEFTHIVCVSFADRFQYCYYVYCNFSVIASLYYIFYLMKTVDFFKPQMIILF